MKTSIIVIMVAAVVIALGGIWYYSQYYSAPQPGQYPSQESQIPTEEYKGPAMPPAMPQTTPSVTEATVAIKNFAFSPSSMTVKKGAKVTFENQDSTTHTVTATAFGGQHRLSPGQSYVLDTADLAAGAYQYHCDIHPTMIGELKVAK